MTYGESRHLGHSSRSLVGLGLLSVDIASEESSRQGRDSVDLHDESSDRQGSSEEVRVVPDVTKRAARVKLELDERIRHNRRRETTLDEGIPSTQGDKGSERLEKKKKKRSREGDDDEVASLQRNGGELAVGDGA